MALSINKTLIINDNIINFKYNDLVQNLVDTIKKYVEERYIILTNENKRFIFALDLKYNYGHRKMTMGQFYHHKGLKYTDISFHNTKYGFVYEESEFDIVTSVINLHRDMLYQHLMYKDRGDKIYLEKCYEYQDIILRVINRTKLIQKQNPIKNLKFKIDNKIPPVINSVSLIPSIGSENPFNK